MAMSIVIRIEFTGSESSPGIVGAVRGTCRFAALPRPGDRVAVASLIEDPARAASTQLPLFLEVGWLEHFPDAPRSQSAGEPQCWAVVRRTAPSHRKACEAIVQAFGEQGWELDGFDRPGQDAHPFVSAAQAWRRDHP